MKNIKVSGRLCFREDEYYIPDDGEVIKLSFGDHSMYVKATRRHHGACQECVLRNKICTSVPLKCTYHYYISLDTVLENI